MNASSSSSSRPASVPGSDLSQSERPDAPGEGGVPDGSTAPGGDEAGKKAGAGALTPVSPAATAAAPPSETDDKSGSETGEKDAEDPAAQEPRKSGKTGDKQALKRALAGAMGTPLLGTVQKPGSDDTPGAGRKSGAGAQTKTPKQGAQKTLKQPGVKGQNKSQNKSQNKGQNKNQNKGQKKNRNKPANKGPNTGSNAQNIMPNPKAGNPNAGNSKAGNPNGGNPNAPDPNAAKPDAAPGATPVSIPPTAPVARTRARHWMALLTFLLMVVMPASLTGWYLWERAVDQYASHVGFSVRTEEVGSAIELLGGSVAGLSGSSSSDTDILYEFLQGQDLVAAIDQSINLRAIWSSANPDIDPVFAYHAPGTIEDLLDHWERKVKIYYDAGTGLIDLRVLAFSAEEAHLIATEIYDRSSAMINELSAIAREDAIGYAREELEQAENRLRDARIAIQSFRNRTQIIDPTIQTQTQSGLIGALESQLAEAQIELQLLLATARPNDPRITQAELKIEVIQRQIAAERSELGVEGSDADRSSVADLVGEYEALAADLEFAQEAYTGTRATFDAARNEARRQSRYLTAHVKPTLAESAKYPQRVTILSFVTLFLFLFWSVVVLVAYALRDRR